MTNPTMAFLNYLNWQNIKSNSIVVRMNKSLGLENYLKSLD